VKLTSSGRAPSPRPIDSRRRQQQAGCRPARRRAPGSAQPSSSAARSAWRATGCSGAADAASEVGRHWPIIPPDSDPRSPTRLASGAIRSEPSPALGPHCGRRALRRALIAFVAGRLWSPSRRVARPCERSSCRGTPEPPDRAVQYAPNGPDLGCGRVVCGAAQAMDSRRSSECARRFRGLTLSACSSGDVEKKLRSAGPPVSPKQARRCACCGRGPRRRAHRRVVVWFLIFLGLRAYRKKDGDQLPQADPVHLPLRVGLHDRAFLIIGGLFYYTVVHR